MLLKRRNSYQVPHHTLLASNDYLQTIRGGWNLPGGSTQIPPKFVCPSTSQFPPGFRAVIESQLIRQDPQITTRQTEWNLGGTSKQVPPPWIPLFIGISDPLGGMWNLFRFLSSAAEYRSLPACLSLIGLALIARASRAYFSRPTRILLMTYENSSDAPN